MTQPEDALSYLLFPAVGKDFLPRKYARTVLRDCGLQEPVEGSAYPI
jgi:oxaloacetate decarboxylase alpha subunit